MRFWAYCGWTAFWIGLRRIFITLALCLLFLPSIQSSPEPPDGPGLFGDMGRRAVGSYGVAHPRAAAAGSEQAIRQAVFEAEDARAPGAAELKVLTEAVRSPNENIQRQAVRALGRLERPELVPAIKALLTAASAPVRAEAANALGQAVHGLRGAVPSGANSDSAATAVADIADIVRARLGQERDPFVRGVLCQTLGRLPYAADAAGVQRAGEALEAAASAAFEEGAGSAPALLGAAKGFESLLRLNAKTAAPGAKAVERLRAMVVRRGPEKAGSQALETAARIRRLALAALTAGRRLDEATVRAAAGDPDEQVRRLAVAALGSAALSKLSAATSESLVMQGLGDASGMVRVEALRLYGRTRIKTDPAPVIAAVSDPYPHAALMAVDLLGQPGSSSEQALERLRNMAGDLRPLGVSGRGALPPAKGAAPISGTWHGPAHALISLARVAPDSARPLLPAYAASPLWPVRMYAARAAAVLRDAPTLEKLSEDAHDNVREESIRGLLALRGHDADAVLIAALARPDYQLIMTAARALRQSPNADRAIPALLAALARLTAQRRDTSRDPRLALLERIGELGSAAHAAALAPYAQDFDPRIAALAAAIVGKWTGRPLMVAPPMATPRPPPVEGIRLDEVERLSTAKVRVTMAGKGFFELALLTGEAPATVARFVRLARAGYYNGLTFHRVASNFLIQGGSPGANEYMGDGPYLRDEVGLESHTRGAVGISTRGRDTGDAQICPDVVDNPRLDHDYTVFARVTAGMEVVDRVLECDVIERIEVMEAAGKPKVAN